MTGQNQFKKERISEAAAQVAEWSMHSDDFCLSVGTAHTWKSLKDLWDGKEVLRDVDPF